MSVPPPPEPMSSLAPPCPNCRQPWLENALACPNCGFLRPAVWPPAPTGQPEIRPRSPSNLITRSVTGDILLGLGVSVVSFIILGIGILLIPILYLTLRRQYPVFARGMGFGWIAGAALPLGLLAVCVAASLVGRFGHP